MLSKAEGRVGRQHESRVGWLVAVVKMLITGAEGSGKRELVETISDVITDSSPTSSSRFDRAKRTRAQHALEFGQIYVDSTLAVQLYVLPADRQADFMWQILSQDAVGFVVLASAERIVELDDTRHMLTVLARTSMPFVVGVNGAEEDDETIIKQAREGLQVGPDVAVCPCDCTDRESVKALLCELFRYIAESLEHRAGQPVSTAD